MLDVSENKNCQKKNFHKASVIYIGFMGLSTGRVATDPVTVSEPYFNVPQLCQVSFSGTFTPVSFLNIES